MTDTPQTLAAFLSDYNGQAIPADDIVHMLVPLMRELSALHERQRVADLQPQYIALTDTGTLALTEQVERLPQANFSALYTVQPSTGSALKIVGEYRVTMDGGAGGKTEDLLVWENARTDRPEKPVFLEGYRSWETRFEHHDAVTDIYHCGLLLAALACGLDFDDLSDVEAFAGNRENLFRLNNRLHPVIATLIQEMTALNRHDRAKDLSDLAFRLEHYRDQPAHIDIERLFAEAEGAQNRRTAVLTHLRDRLFDLSRRNRLIHFRPTQASINCTEASVPMVMRIESIKPSQLCTWNDKFRKDVLSGKRMKLSAWLRFEDHPYLKTSVDRILQQSRRDRNEFGFSHLRLVIAFFNWRNLKEAPNDAIKSPLLWLPVHMVKTKGVRDQYTLDCNETIAEVNPALRYHLRQLYNIHLPETIDLEETSVEDLHELLAAQIAASEPSVTLALQTKPVIQLIHQKASQRIQQYERRRGGSARKTKSKRPEFSYSEDDYRPLGQALFEQYIRPSPLPQRAAVGAMPSASPQFAVPATDGSAEAATYSMGKTSSHQFDWSVDLTEVTIANLNYKKMSLVRDYTALVDASQDLEAFDRVFSVEPKDFANQSPAPLATNDQWTVVPVDRTQAQAISLAREEDSFIIQGPPGTGKSQTITNLIADYVARGKRVLFVCEKRAALDVVFYRLKQVGLDRLSTLVHDSQEDKKSFVMDLKDVYETWGNADPQTEYHDATRARTLAAYQEHIRQIDTFEQAMQTTPKTAGASIRTLINRRLACPPMALEVAARDRQSLPELADWEANTPDILQIHRTVQSLFGLNSLAAHPFAQLKQTLAEDDTAIGKVEDLIETVLPKLDRIEKALERGETPITEEMTFGEAEALLTDAANAHRTGLHLNLDLLDEKSDASQALAATETELGALAAIAAQKAERTQNWTSPLDREDAQFALAQAERQENSILRFFSPSWWKLSGKIKASYNFDDHAVTPAFSVVLKRLVEQHDAEDTHHAALKTAGNALGTTDLLEMLSVRDDWLQRVSSDPGLEALIEHADAGGDPEETFSAAIDARRDMSDFASSANELLEAPGQLELSALIPIVRGMQEDLDDLADLQPSLKLLGAMPSRVAQTVRRYKAAPSELETLVLDETLARALRRQPQLREIDISRLEDSVRRARAAQDLLHEQNGTAILAASHQAFNEHVKISLMSTAQLDEAERDFKKLYASGRREVENEFRKTMRYKSIRDLADGDSGAVIRDLKPIWLMSPLSVSDTLPLDQGLFDVVIFDEASQIPMEEAVPALCRAPQVIIVGDEMQLPPTSFFSTSADEDEQQIDIEENGTTIAIVLDADSLLNQAARTLPATLLSWHYRSRSESLISFSNAAFYDGRLTTVPDVELATSLPDTIETQTGSPADQTLIRPISFHKLEKGLYANRQNAVEADYIAEMTREFLSGKTDKSIGIVAFSEAQQDAIEAALMTLAGKDASFAAKLEDAFTREDDGQFNGLFVKNLENVQGDERDIIILSICYGPNAEGQMRMNFGPINQRGGEKRLNVIFSRAKHHMAVVSSIHAEMITNVHNDGARALRTFLSFASSESSGQHSSAMSALTTLNPDAKRIFGGEAPEHIVRTQIAEGLRARGHAVDEWVGNASLRCDLAIKSTTGPTYSLGVLIDRTDASDQSRLIERYVFQPGLLEAFGWRIIDLPSHLWHAQPDLILDQLEAAIATPTPPSSDFDPFELERVSGRTASGLPISKPVLPPVPEKVETVATMSREFHFVGGAHNKFWRVDLVGCDLTIRYGRVGAKGRTMIKSFDTEDDAERQMNKLVSEKLNKGYEEVEAGPAD